MSTNDDFISTLIGQNFIDGNNKFANKNLINYQTMSFFIILVHLNLYPFEYFLSDQLQYSVGEKIVLMRLYGLLQKNNYHYYYARLRDLKRYHSIAIKLI